MAEEDLIWAKNRHMFGGIEPPNVIGFSANISGVSDSNQTVKITGTCLTYLPQVTMTDGGYKLTPVEGVIIRKKSTGYPKDEFDGELLKHITSKSAVANISFTTTVATDQPMYYAAFPYSKQGVFNRSIQNRASVNVSDIPAGTYLYGYDLDLSDSNPATRVSYPADVMNAGYTPAKMNFTSGSFEYGGWPSTAGDKFIPKPCILNADGTVVAYLDPDDYAKFADGTTSNITNTTYMSNNKRNAMMEWPKIYTHREVVNGVYKFRCSNKKLGSNWDCWCNYDINDEEIDHFYTAIYPAYITGSGDTLLPISMSGRDISTYSSFASSPVYIYNYPKKVGSDWNVEVLADRLLIQDLLVMMAKTTDGQAAYGYAYGNTTANTGFQDTKGLFYGHDGSESGTTGPVKVFGMEGFYSWYGRLMAGLVLDASDVKVKLTSGTHDGSSATDYNTTGSGYISVASLADYTSTIGSYSGYISGTLDMSYGRIPILKDGSASTYECDTINYFRASSGVQYPYVGGNYSAVEATILAGGPFNINMSRSMSESSTWGVVALSCKPRRTV